MIQDALTLLQQAMPADSAMPHRRTKRAIESQESHVCGTETIASTPGQMRPGPTLAQRASFDVALFDDLAP